MKLCNGRKKIIELFEDKNIKPSDFPHNAKSEPEEFEREEFEPEEFELEEFEPEEFEPEFEESITERTKMRKQKSDEEN